MNLQVNQDKDRMNEIFIKSAKERKRIKKKPQRRINNHIEWKG